MSQPSGKPIYIPPFSNIRLIGCRDHFQLVPVPAVRTLYDCGKIKAGKATMDPDDPHSGPIWNEPGPDMEFGEKFIWLAARESV